MIRREVLYDEDGRKCQLVTDEKGDQSVTVFPSGKTTPLRSWAGAPSRRLVRS